MEKRVKKIQSLIPQHIFHKIQKDFGNITKVTKNDIALSNLVFILEINYKKSILLKIFSVKNKKIFNYYDHKKMIEYLFHKNITPNYLFFNHEYCLLSYIEGSHINQDLLSSNEVNQITKIIKTIHSCNLNINKRSFSKILDKYLKYIPKNYFPENIIVELKYFIDKVITTISKFHQDLCVCHNDLHAHNFIQKSNYVYIIDFEYVSINDKYFDFASLLRLLGEKNFYIFSQQYDIIIDKDKLYIYDILSDLCSCMWYMMMLGLNQNNSFDYLSYGKKSFINIRDKLSNL